MIYLTTSLIFKNITIFYDNIFYLRLNKSDFDYYSKSYNYLSKTLRFLISRII